MVDRVEAYRRQVGDAVDLWQANVCNPYVIAYNSAYKNYNDAFARQKESDKARAELFVSAAALLPGSVLMATAASSSLRVLANKAALRMMASLNVKRTLSVYQAIGNSPTAMFAIGKVLDGVKGEAGKKIQDAVTKTMQVSVDFLAADPLNRDKQLQSWLLNHKICAFDAAAAIEEDRTLSPRDKDARFAELRQAPIANRPQGAINAAKLAPKIELGFYMMALLDSDELISTEAAGVSPYGGGGGRSTSKPIDEMPSSAKYPRAKMPTTAPGYTGSYQTIGITRPGSDVEDQIDKVCIQVTGKPFYAASGFFGKPDTRKGQELIDAEYRLKALADSTRPLSPLGLAS